MITRLNTTVLTTLTVAALAVFGLTGTSAQAQTATPLDCLPGSTGPTAGDPTPYPGGMCNLGTLRADNSDDSSAFAVSADGSTIVGLANTDDANSRAFRWMDDGTGMLDLGTLRADNSGDSSAHAVSADGSTIVGYAATDDASNHAFRWMDDGTGMLDLGTLRADNSGNSSAQAVSADGSTIVGYAETDEGDFHAFIWRTQMQDLENLMLSFGQLANDTEVAVATQRAALGGLLSRDCTVAGVGQSCLRVGGNLTRAADAGGNTGTTPGGWLSAGWGLENNVTIGASLSFAGVNLDRAFDTDTGYALGLWATYHADGHPARTGLQAALAFGIAHNGATITRGEGLENVQLARGEADLDSRAIQARLGYGIDQGNGWLLTPSVGLSHTRTTRSAYAESGADFNASYDRMQVDETTLDLAFTRETAVGSNGRLAHGLGVEHDLNADQVRLTGTSDLPSLASFDIASTLPRNDTRAFATAAYTHTLAAGGDITVDARIGRSAYGSTPQASLGISYGISF